MSDGMESLSRSMLGIADMNGTNTDGSPLIWSTITKGKRSRKGRSKLASETPKRVGEDSGSDTDKFDETSLADGLGCVPIKKRRHHLHSPSQNIEQSPPEQELPSLHSEKFEQLSDNNGLSCNQSLDIQPHTQRLSGALENNSDDTINLSGIALLATAACIDSIDGDLDNVKPDVDVTQKHPTLRKCHDSSIVTIPGGVPILVKGGSDPEHDEGASVADPDNVTHDVTEESLMKCNDTSTVTIPVGEPIQVQERSNHGKDKCVSLAEEAPGLILAENNQKTDSISVSPVKVDRCFWDLNKAMEEWEVPQDDMVVRELSVVDASTEERCSAQSDSVNNGSSINVSLAPVDVATASFNSKVDENERVGSTLPKNYEQHMNDAEEDYQKTSEFSQDRKKCEMMDVGMLPKTSDVSTSDISNAGPLAVCGGGNGSGQGEKAIVTDAMDTNDATDHDVRPVHKGEIAKISISLDSVADDDHGLSEATQNISELQVDYDSPYEDGELRLPALYSCDRNEIVYDEEDNECVDYDSDGIVGDDTDPGDHPGSEVVEAGSEGSQALEKKYSVPAQQISETVTSNSSLNFKEENNVVKLLKPEAKKLSNQGSGTTDELPVMPLVQDNNDSMMRRERNFDHVDSFNSRGGSYLPEFGMTREKTRPYNASNMSFKHGGDSFSRSERGRGGADRTVARRGSSFGGHRQTGGYNNWNYKDSTNRYQYRGSEDNWQQNKTRNAAFADSIDKFDDANSYEQDHQPVKFSSKGNERPFFRKRSPVDRDDYYGDHGGFMPASRGGYNNSNINRRGSYGKFSGRGFGRGRREEEYIEPAVDDVSSGRFSGGYLHRGEQRCYSPSNRAAPHVSVPSWKSRSRSRTRSPRAWQSQRDGSFNTTRRRSRSPSPEFRSELGIERTRGPIPYQKRNLNADYTKRFVSPPKACFSPTRNNRWVNDNRNFANPPLRHPRRSPPVGGQTFRQQSQKFGGPPGRFGSVGDNNIKAEENCGDRRRFGLGDHNVRHSGTSNILRRPRHDGDMNGTCEDDNISNDNGGRDMSFGGGGGADYEERFSSPQQNSNNNSNRWSDEKDADNSNNNGNSSPLGMRRVQRPKQQDDYFRPSVTTRPGGRFTTSIGGGRGDWGSNNGRRRNLD